MKAITYTNINSKIQFKIWNNEYIDMASYNLYSALHAKFNIALNDINTLRVNLYHKKYPMK